MGEALRRLDERDHDTASKITDFKRIIGFRNVLIHGYSLVNHERVGRSSKKSFPCWLARWRHCSPLPARNRH